MGLTLLTTVTPVSELAAADSFGKAKQIARPVLRTTLSDVELGQGGVLVGQIVDSAGQPLVGQPIVAQHVDGKPISCRSDQQGRFRIAGLKSGICRVGFGETILAYRCWSPNTAPPSAGQQLLLTASDSIKRGQRPIADLFTGPLLIGLIIGAAIAIPIAVSNSNDDAS
jgi:hypothetical protein